MAFDILKKFHGNIENRTISNIDFTVEKISKMLETLTNLKRELVTYRARRYNHTGGSMETSQQRLQQLVQELDQAEAQLEELEKQEERCEHQLLDYERGANAPAEIIFKHHLIKQRLERIGFTFHNNRGGCTLSRNNNEVLFIPRKTVVFHKGTRHYGSRGESIVHIRAFDPSDKREMLNYDILTSGQIIESDRNI
jgi:DNA-binding transcriptional MerR regulator